MAEKEAIMRALREAMGSSPSAPMTSPSPRLRPKGMSDSGTSPRPRLRPKGFGMSNADRRKMILGGSGRSISDADRAMVRQMLGDQSLREKNPTADPMDLSPAQIKMLEQMIKQQNRVRDAAERKAFPPPSMMNNGGAVRKAKPKKGCVMKGRGGKYKGIK